MINNKKVIEEFREIGGYRSTSSKVENFILKTLSAQRQEIKETIEEKLENTQKLIGMTALWGCDSAISVLEIVKKDIIKNI